MSTEWVLVNATMEDSELEFLPGMLVEFIEEGRSEKDRVLVGHINANGGRCDCCIGIRSADFIVRYKILVDNFED